MLIYLAVSVGMFAVMARHSRSNPVECFALFAMAGWGIFLAISSLIHRIH